MDEIIKKIAFFTPDTPDQMPACDEGSFNQDSGICQSSCGHDLNDSDTTHSHDNLQNYMFFRNLKAMRDHIDEMLSMDTHSIDQQLTDQHDWATDHIASAHENIEQVYGWLSAGQNESSTY